MRVRSLLASSAVILATALPLAQAPVDLSGTWRLNADASDVGGTGGDESEMPAAGRLPVGGLGMPGRQPLGGYGSPAGIATTGPDADPRARKQQMQLLQELLEPVRKLSITQDASVVSFSYDDGRTVRYRTNGKTERHQAINGVVETETRWKKGRLVRETSLDNGVTIEETFTLTSPRGLSIEIEIGGGVGRRKPIKRIYDPVE
jgi:ribosomal protein L19